MCIRYAMMIYMFLDDDIYVDAYANDTDVFNCCNYWQLRVVILNWILKPANRIKQSAMQTAVVYLSI